MGAKLLLPVEASAPSCDAPPWPIVPSPDPDDLITAVRRCLRQLQHRHDVLDGCLTGTGLRRQPP